MKPVIQLETTGCGFASAAALVGVSYPQLKSVANSMGIFAQDPKLWSDTSYIRRVLKHYGIKTAPQETPFKSWDLLPNLALLSIKWHKEKGVPVWHWVVFVREKGQAYFLDPGKRLRNHRRTDFGRMKPKWYISVVKP